MDTLGTEESVRSRELVVMGRWGVGGGENTTLFGGGKGTIFLYLQMLTVA